MMRGRSLLFTFALLTASIAGAMALVPGAAAQGDTCSNPNVGCCGDIDLLLLNPGLNPDSSGFINAQGQLFIQFQAIGADADKIATFGFSFGAYTTQFPDDVCSAPASAWFTGQQVSNYRADTDPSDGFFINLITPIVPDNKYTAAVHAYDDNDNELARFWAQAIVNNCDGNGDGEFCRDDTEQHIRNDQTPPWPIVLPGDGMAPTAAALTIEFGEEIAEMTVFLNGDDITDQMEDWEGRMWDADYFPGYGPQGLSAILVPECSLQPPQQCQPFGQAYKWDERELTEDDVLRVEARDLAGNLAVKDIHVGSGVTGGAISDQIPILEWSVDQIRVDAAPGETALFRFEIRNSGGETGHPFADQEVPPGWDFEWQPVHVPVPSGTTENQEFLVTVPQNATADVYDVIAYMDYDQAGDPKQLQQLLRINVVTDNVGEEEDPDGESEGPAKKSPGPALPAIVAFGLGAVALRRR